MAPSRTMHKPLPRRLCGADWIDRAWLDRRLRPIRASSSSWLTGLKNGSLDKPEQSELGLAWSPRWSSIRKYDESIDFVACVRADIWRRPGWDGRSALAVGTSFAPGLQGRRKADRGPDWHTDRTRTGSVDRIRKDYVRPENKPGQAVDRNDHPSGRSGCTIRTGRDISPKAPAAEHTTDG